MASNTPKPVPGRSEIFLVFLRLGCTSFGGPIAHLGYFQRELIQRRAWFTEDTYAEVIGLAQALPGPSSSQVGFALGLLRGGWLGGIAAWTAFTLPSALLMLAFAAGNNLFANPSANPSAAHVLHGLQLIAVAVVAQAVLAMQRSLAPNLTRLAIATVGAAIVLFLPSSLATLLAIAMGTAAGLLLCRQSTETSLEAPPTTLSKTFGTVAASLFVLLLLASEIIPSPATPTLSTVAAAFYRSGALVFGGGHVVLPLLEAAVVRPGWVTLPNFLAGYGAAQALPGPVFSFSAYLGALIGSPTHRTFLDASVALLALSIPGLLAMAAVLPFWSTLRNRPNLRAALRGINASVVGVLLAALIRPLITTAIHSVPDATLSLAAFALLVWTKLPVWAVVLGGALLCLIVPAL